MTSACEVSEGAEATDAPGLGHDAQICGEVGESSKEGDGAEPCNAESAISISLEACSDARLLASLPVLLSALPDDSRERCLLSLRGALTDEIEGGALAGDPSMIDAWHRALTPPQSLVKPPAPTAPEAPPPVSGKRPFRAMAAPFAQDPVPKRRDGIEHGSTESSSAVYVANVPYTATEDVISDFFVEHCSPGQVASVRLLRGADGKPKGAAVVKFDSVEMVGRAMMLNGQYGLEGRKLIVREDNGPPGKSSGKGKVPVRAEVSAGAVGDADRHESKVKAKRASNVGGSEADCRSAIVKNLDFRASAADLGELFAGCGGVAATRIAKDARTGRSKGFAVVEFVDASFLPEVLRRSGRQVRGRPVRVELVGDHQLPTAEIPSSGAAETQVVDPVCRDDITVAGDDAGSAIGSKIGSGSTGRETGGNLQDVLKSHAQDLLARAQVPPEEAAASKRSRGEAAPRPDVEYPSGESGLTAAVALASAHATAGALLAAAGPEELKGRLAALGLKSGGAPLDRATRLLQLVGVARLEDLPKELLAKPRKGIAAEVLAPVLFVKAGEGNP